MDPWSLLGIDPGASARQVHEAWRRQVGKWHPDRNPSPDATLRLL
jgi:curved DNA-binding protein CbpA